jgi:hypothetical protein
MSRLHIQTWMEAGRFSSVARLAARRAVGLRRGRVIIAGRS